MDTPTSGASWQAVFHTTNTYDHRTLKTRLPVRSALFKQRTGGLVVRWVTTSEYPLLYVFDLFYAFIFAMYAETWGVVNAVWRGDRCGCGGFCAEVKMEGCLRVLGACIETACRTEASLNTIVIQQLTNIVANLRIILNHLIPA